MTDNVITYYRNRGEELVTVFAYRVNAVSKFTGRPLGENASHIT